MISNVKKEIDKLELSDLYSLMLFILYKIKDVPEYATLSELCFLLDGSNLNRLLTYFAGKTITIPSESDFEILTNAMMLFEYVQMEGNTLAYGLSKLKDLTPKQKQKVQDLYVKIIPIIKNYNFNRGDKHEKK